MSTRVKICGITSIEDAEAAVAAGADALGFMFVASSPRFLEFAAAQKIIASLPPFVARVGVFVNATEEFITTALQTCSIDVIQLHGDEAPDFCASIRTRARVIKAFRIHNEDSLTPLPKYPVDAWLLDSFVPGQHGGTGAIFNWNLAVRAQSMAGSRPVILAGGLTSQNVAQAVREVHPYGVDVSSGVEKSPGRKKNSSNSSWKTASSAGRTSTRCSTCSPSGTARGKRRKPWP